MQLNVIILSGTYSIPTFSATLEYHIVTILLMRPVHYDDHLNRLGIKAYIMSIVIRSCFNTGKLVIFHNPMTWGYALSKVFKVTFYTYLKT